VSTFQHRGASLSGKMPCDICKRPFREHSWNVSQPDFEECPPFITALSHDEWHAQRIRQFEVNGESYSMEQVVRAIHLLTILPATLDEMAHDRGYEYDNGWQEAIAQIDSKMRDLE